MRNYYNKNNFGNGFTNRLLCLLIVLDSIFIVAHLLIIYLVFIRGDFDLASAQQYLVNKDGGYPEIFQYIKYLLVLGIIVYRFIKKKEYRYFSWLILFTLLLLDDSLKFHERFGAWVIEQFNYPLVYGFRAQDLGELTYVILFGSFLMLFMVIGYFSGNEKYKKINIDLSILLSIFLFFGIVVDMLHGLMGDNRYVNSLFIVLEDGGEMFSLSLFVWYFLFLLLKPESHSNYLYHGIYKYKYRPIDKALVYIFFYGKKENSLLNPKK